METLGIIRNLLKAIEETLKQMLLLSVSAVK